MAPLLRQAGFDKVRFTDEVLYILNTDHDPVSPGKGESREESGGYSSIDPHLSRFTQTDNVSEEANADALVGAFRGGGDAVS